MTAGGHFEHVAAQPCRRPGRRPGQVPGRGGHVPDRLAEKPGIRWPGDESSVCCEIERRPTAGVVAVSLRVRKTARSLGQKHREQGGRGDHRGSDGRPSLPAAVRPTGAEVRPGLDAVDQWRRRRQCSEIAEGPGAKRLA